MKGESLWITSVDDHEPSKPVLDFIKEQASYLSEETGGKVKAVLAPAGTSWRSIISSLSLFSEDSYHPTHHSNANDASSLYKKRTYEFYIVDEKIKFRICDADIHYKLRYAPDTVYARYNTEVGKDNQIPLWLLGFLY